MLYVVNVFVRMCWKWSYRVWLIRLNSFDLPQFTTLTTGDGSFRYTTSLSLTSLIDLIQFIRSSSINIINYRRVVILWNNFIEFDQFEWFDLTHSIFLNWQHSLQEMNHSIKQLHWVWPVWLIWFNSFDLPQLTAFTTGENSFYKTTSLSLTSLIDLIQLIGSYSINSNLIGVVIIPQSQLLINLKCIRASFTIRCSFQQRRLFS